MSLPTLIKTWQVSKNNTVAAQGSVAATEKRIIRTVKNLFLAPASGAWTVWGSNSGAGTFGNNDGVDRWTTDTDIVKAGAGSNHSWFVLKQTGIHANFQLCFDCLGTFAMSIVISPAAGFGTVGGGANGTATARPTATDEIVLISNTTWFSQVDAQHQIHFWQSTDGQCARLAIWRAGTNMCTFWLFEKPRNPRTGWSNPSVSIAKADTVGISNSIAVLNVSLVNGVARGRGTATMTITLTGEGTSAGLLANVSPTSSQTNDFDSTWDFSPIGLASDTTSNKGRHGMLNDLWWAPLSVTDADTFPNDANDRQFVKMGGLLLPWDPAGSTIPLLT